MCIRLITFAFILYTTTSLSSQAIDSLDEFTSSAARQAVAVDNRYVYVIANKTIEKHEKSTGKLIQSWQDTTGVFQHLNSGIVKDGYLYCAHSNFPEIPMASSIEIFDCNSLEPVGSHSFGVNIGSATWIDWHDGHWYVAFAQYNRFKELTGRDNRWTQIIKYTSDWQRVSGWILPPDLIQRFDSMSNSGGYITEEGKIYLTGHDFKEVYVLEFPDHGFTLRWIRTLKAPFEGQGIAVDPGNPSILYGIQRSQQKVVKGKIKYK